MPENDRKPSLRFKGFNDAWEQRKYGEIFNYERPDLFIVSSEEYSDTFDTPVLTANKGFILGYTNETRTYNKPCIIFDDFTLDTKYVDFPFMVKSSAMKMLTIKEGFDLRFSYELLSTSKIENLGHARHYISVVQPTTVRTPKLSEQQEISRFFQKMDTLITLHQRKYDKLVNVKKALLDKMFPETGNDVPKIRFKGFTDTWEQCELGTYVDITTGKLDANAMAEDGLYDFYTSGIAKYRINNFAFEGPAITIAGNGATVGYMHLADGKFNAYQRTYVLSNFRIDRLFSFHAISRKLPQKIANEARTGNIPYIVMEMLTKLNITKPENDEQLKIGEFFKSLDSLITLHQRKHEKLQNIKKALLSKMFA